MTITQLFSCELTDMRCRRAAPWGRSDRSLPRPRQPSSAAIFCWPKPGGIAGSGSLSHPQAGRTPRYPGVAHLPLGTWGGKGCWWFFMDLLCCLRISPFYLLRCRQWWLESFRCANTPAAGQRSLSRRIFFVSKSFNRVRYNFSVFPYSP